MSVAEGAGAAEVAVIVADSLLLRPWVCSSEVGALTTQAVAVLVVKHRAERHSSADLAMLPCLCGIMFGEEVCDTKGVRRCESSPPR